MDHDEISQHYRHLGPLIYRRCLRLLGDPEVARDATQEVFVRLLRHKERLYQDRDCLPWLYRVATNYCLNVLRDSKRLTYLAPQEIPEPLHRVATEEAWLARRSILRLLDQLDDRICQIAVHSLMDGMTQEEIAQVMGLSRKTVGKKLNQFSSLMKTLSNQEEHS